MLLMNATNGPLFELTHKKKNIQSETPIAINPKSEKLTTSLRTASAMMFKLMIK
jgi:hypothetical protein